MDLHFAAAYSPLWLTLIFIVSAVILFIARKNRTFYWRLATVIFLLFLLLRPEISYTRTAAQTRKVALLLDNSGSMSLKEGGSSRIRRAAQIAGKIKDQIKDLTIIPFNDRAASPLTDSEALTALTAADRGTNFTAAFTAIAAMQPAPAQVILISDGNDTTDNDAIAAAKKLRIPINIVMVGEAPRAVGGVDVRITAVHHREKVSVEALEPIEIDLEADNAAGRSVTIELRDGEGKVLQTAETILDGRPGPQSVTMNYKATKLGINDLTAAAVPLAGETVIANNRYDFSLNARRKLPKVLYLESEMRPDYRFLRRALATDPQLEFMALVQSRPGVFIRQGEISGLALANFPRTESDFAGIDGLILGNFSAEEIAPVAGALRAAVAGGMGLLVLPGAYTTGEQSKYAFDFFPCRPQGKTVVAPRAGALRETDFFPSPQLKEAALPLAGVDLVTATMNATAVMTAGEDGGVPTPLLLTAPCGAGRTAVFTGHDAWRWNPATYAEFWGGLVRWLLKKEKAENEEELQITAAPTVANIGEEITITASDPQKRELHYTVRASDASPADNKAAASFPEPAKPDAGGEIVKSGEFSLDGKTNQWTAKFALQTAGGYRLSVTAGAKENKPAEQSLSLRVRPARSEFARLAPDREFLQRLADATGGIFYSNAAPLTDLQLEKTERWPLGNKNVLFVLIGICLIGEWLWRKHLGLP